MQVNEQIKQAESDARRLQQQAHHARNRGVQESTIRTLYTMPASMCWQAAQKMRRVMEQS